MNHADCRRYTSGVKNIWIRAHSQTCDSLAGACSRLELELFAKCFLLIWLHKKRFQKVKTRGGTFSVKLKGITDSYKSLFHLGNSIGFKVRRNSKEDANTGVEKYFQGAHED